MRDNGDTDRDTDGSRNERIAVLAHGGFPDGAKTAVGLVRYSDSEVVAVLDREKVGKTHLDVNVYGSTRDVLEDHGIDALYIGIAPIGGGFDETWRPDVRTALENGVDVVSGLHYFLSEDDEFSRLADENDAEIEDVRKTEFEAVAEGVAGEVEAHVVLTVGTDCSTGKMTTAVELVEEARERGYDAEFAPTGQTGIMIEGDGHPIDRVVSDFAAGAVEETVVERGNSDFVFVEGQGSILHPAYSGVTASILHGSMPDSLVLCHEAGRQRVKGYENFEIADLGEVAETYEKVALTGTIDAVSLNTSGLGEEEAERAIEEASETAPASDVVRHGPGEILDVLEEETG
ncbi:MAG: DUF1611 domain-containing protein [Halobacteria archaeon]|nr:DUF1611 domain-containing protein [Halobacteria archaeon]